MLPFGWQTHVTSNKHVVRCMSRIHTLSEPMGSDELKFSDNALYNESSA